MTWNLGGKKPREDLELKNIILPSQQEVDLYVIGIQEMVNLDMIGSVMCNKDEERMYLWE